MNKKLLLCIALLGSFYAAKAQSFNNLVFATEITSTTTTVNLTFDYSGVSAGDVFEWQLFLALPDGSPDWGSGRNIAWQGNIDPTSVGSGTQTLTFNLYNDPLDGEVFTWAGKITLASDGSDTGYNNTGNLVTIDDALSTPEYSEQHTISLYPNPVQNNLHINNNGIEIKSIAIVDIAGKLVYQSINFTEIIDVSTLKEGLYFLRINNSKPVKFIKQ